MKKCKYCNKEIQDTAKKCRFCNKWLNEEENNYASKIEKKSYGLIAILLIVGLITLPTIGIIFIITLVLYVFCDISSDYVKGLNRVWNKITSIFKKKYK